MIPAAIAGVFLFILALIAAGVLILSIISALIYWYANRGKAPVVDSNTGTNSNPLQGAISSVESFVNTNAAPTIQEIETMVKSLLANPAVASAVTKVEQQATKVQQQAVSQATTAIETKAEDLITEDPIHAAFQVSEQTRKLGFTQTADDMLSVLQKHYGRSPDGIVTKAAAAIPTASIAAGSTVVSSGTASAAA